MTNERFREEIEEVFPIEDYMTLDDFIEDVIDYYGKNYDKEIEYEVKKWLEEEFGEFFPEKIEISKEIERILKDVIT